MTKTELESKHIAELHALAAEAGVPRYRMLRREELVEKLAGEQSEPKPSRERESGGERKAGGERQRSRSRRSRGGGESRERGPRQGGEERQQREPRQEREPRQQREPRQEREPRQSRRERPKAEATAEEKEAEAPTPPAREESRGGGGAGRAERSTSGRRRRRRFGRKRKDLRLHDLLVPATPGRQAVVYAETAESCTSLLRDFAAEVAGSNGTDPVVLLIDPGPEELAEWRRAAPEAEIVAAAQARHAEDALAQAARRAEGGEQVIVLVDSLTRMAEKFGDADAAKGLLDGSGTLTVVAALERR